MWPDLPPDLLREISSRLHDAAHFVIFHAVCKPWRHSHRPTTRKDRFLPWLVAAPKEKDDDDDSLKLRCVFSGINYLVLPPSSSGTTGRNWVASAGGTAVLYFTANSPYGPTLHDPLTGTVVTHLPLFLDGQWTDENPGGIVYTDGTVLVYSKCDAGFGNGFSNTVEFKAALLHPGDQGWTVVHRTLKSPFFRGALCVAYHSGKILVTVGDELSHVVTTTAADDMLIPGPTSMPCGDDYLCVHNYVLESRGELLWASVHIGRDDYLKKFDENSTALALRVSVHALEDEEVHKPRWVWKEGTSLADRVLFLGCPNSFAVEASGLDMNGGSVYFIYDDFGYNNIKHGRVFSYNLVDNTTELVDCLPHGWDDKMRTWLVPQPTIAPIPIHEGPPTTPIRNNMIHIQRSWFI